MQSTLYVLPCLWELPGSALKVAGESRAQVGDGWRSWSAGDESLEPDASLAGIGADGLLWDTGYRSAQLVASLAFPFPARARGPLSTEMQTWHAC